MKAALLGVGAHRPARVVTNDELSQTLDTSDAWIRRRTGIAQRHVAGPDESVVQMGAEAAGKALAAAGVSPAEIDLVLLATCSAPTAMPGLAPQIATALGCANVGALDVNGACAGFCYALALAADTVRAGSARHVLVVGSERMTDIVDQTDRGTAVIFGDGAGAVVVGPAGGAGDEGIGPVVWGSDGTASEAIIIRDRWLEMDGAGVYRWATSAVAPVCAEACRLAGIDPSELGALIPHQANLRIVDAIATALGATGAAVADDVVTSGNTSSASIPLALARMLETGAAASGDAALLVGFGAGLSWAAQVVRIP